MSQGHDDHWNSLQRQRRRRRGCSEGGAWHLPCCQFSAPVRHPPDGHAWAHLPALWPSPGKGASGRRGAEGARVPRAARRVLFRQGLRESRSRQASERQGRARGAGKDHRPAPADRWIFCQAGDEFRWWQVAWRELRGWQAYREWQAWPVACRGLRAVCRGLRAVCRGLRAWPAVCPGLRAWPVACRDWRVPFHGPFHGGLEACLGFHPDVLKACPCQEPSLGLRARRVPLWLRAGRGVYHREGPGDPLRVSQVFQAGQPREAPPQEACPESRRQAAQEALR